MDTLHQRLLKSFEYLKNKGLVHTQTQFAEILGKPQQSINAAFKDAPKRCTLGLMTRIADAFPDVLSRDYLLSGTGSPAAPDRSLRPHVAADAAAGFLDSVSNGDPGLDLRPQIPIGSDYDFSISVKGDSMEPEIRDGDTLCCSFASDRANLPLGDICVLDTDEGALVKVLHSFTSSSVTLRSLNPRYADLSLPASSILHVARVDALLRLRL